MGLNQVLETAIWLLKVATYLEWNHEEMIWLKISDWYFELLRSYLKTSFYPEKEIPTERKLNACFMLLFFLNNYFLSLYNSLIYLPKEKMKFYF